MPFTELGEDRFMNKCKVGFSQKSVNAYSGALLVFLAAANGKKVPKCEEAISSTVKTLFTLGDFKGKKEENILLYPGQSGLSAQFSCQRVLIMGTGELKKDSDKNLLAEDFRVTGGNISALARKVKAEELLLVLPEFFKERLPELGAHLTEGILLGNYQFKKYKKQEREQKYDGLGSINFHGKGSALRKAVRSASTWSEAAMVARDMANEPANHWTPDHFSSFGRNLARKTDLQCKVMNKSQLKKMGMGGIIAVNQGSDVEPRMIVLEHQPKSFRKTVLLVGKGITFDSGGISLKPAAGMEDMKYDMCGGAAVISAMQAVAEEKPNVRVVAIIPATDNLAGGAAVKPGDVITHYNGVTSEVVNTDAEGRLVLADALAYGIKKYEPDCVVDLATLTGAVIIGLGHHRTGLMSNNDTLSEALSRAGDETGEKLWRLPLDSEYTKQIDSEVADIKNIGGRPGGTITAAAYLQKFVGSTPWAHLDIAGTAWEYTQKSYVPKGPSGIGVRLLLNFINNCSRLKL